MKVSCVTLPALALLLATAGCHAAKPARIGPALATPPQESITLHVAGTDADPRVLVRRALFNEGIQVDNENRKDRWMRASLGGLWEDRLRYKQWFVVASYHVDPVAARTVIILRGIEQTNSYLAGTAARGISVSPVAGSSTARVGLVSDASQGHAGSVWRKLERVAFALGEQGAERVQPVSR